MNFSEFKHEDYLKLKWHFALLGVCILVLAGIFFGIAELDSRATRTLNIARAEMDSAQTQLDQIEQEETTIIEYTPRYLEIDAAGITDEKDPIDIIEKSERIRAEYNLPPIQMTRTGLEHFTLPYDTSVYEAGKPVHLETTRVEVGLPLVHEGDLVNFLDAMLGGPELVIATECSITANTDDFRALRQNLNSSCQFLWYTFAVEGEDGGRL